MAGVHAANSLNNRKLVQVALTTRDLERSRRFYRDVLGLTLLFETGGMLFFDMGGTRLLIGTENIAGQPGGSVLYFDAPDIESLGSALESRGVDFAGAPEIVQRTETHELKLRLFRDPDGNPLALMGLVPR